MGDGKPDCEKWLYGPWGEDKFMQECLDRQSVPKVEDFQLTTSGTCPHDRPQGQKKNKDFVPACGTVQTPAVHPFRNPTAWFACLGTIVKKDFTKLTILRHGLGSSSICLCAACASIF